MSIRAINQKLAIVNVVLAALGTVEFLPLQNEAAEYDLNQIRFRYPASGREYFADFCHDGRGGPQVKLHRIAHIKLEDIDASQVYNEPETRALADLLLDAWAKAVSRFSAAA